MSSIGRYVSGGSLTLKNTLSADLVNCNTLSCSNFANPISTPSHTIGLGNNQAALEQEGSLFSIRFSTAHELEEIATTDGSPIVSFLTADNHNMTANEVFSIPTVPEPDANFNGIPRDTFTSGLLQVESISDPKIFTVDIGENATASSALSFTGYIQIDRFLTVDMGKHSPDWIASTGTKPTPVHSNDVPVFFA